MIRSYWNSFDDKKADVSLQRNILQGYTHKYAYNL